MTRPRAADRRVDVDALRSAARRALGRHPRAGPRAGATTRFAPDLGADIEQQRARRARAAAAIWPSRHAPARLPDAVRRQRRRRRRRSPRSRCSRYGDLSLLVKAGVQWGLFGGAVLHLGTERHHAALPAPTSSRSTLLGCFAMTETGHGSDVAVAAHHRDVRPGDRRVRDPHPARRAPARTTSATPPATAGWPSSSPSSITGGESAGRARVPRADPRRRTANRCPACTIEDCGPQGRAQRRRQRPALVRPRAGAAREPAQPLRRRRAPTAPTRRRSRTRPGASSPCSARWSRAGSASPARPAAPAKVALTIAVRYAEVRRQFAAPGADGRSSLLDYPTHQRRLLPALATSYALHFAQSELVAGLHESFTRGARAGGSHRRGRQPARARDRGRPASRRSPPGTPPTRSRPAARPAAAPATSPRTGCPGSRPTPTCSPPSRATTPCCCSWWPRSC